ncbi:MAG: hypothetical protein EZS28_050864 [Streblomastix strix]|uniref:Uncharacterized protein n=1 Tax=Streblomastix strix TaxID=222440 RepID=A0A5J4T5E1_9EUKA|nr:MAG: hypothetical protein EZS28_050864 [Streblomastix strix]
MLIRTFYGKIITCYQDDDAFCVEEEEEEVEEEEEEVEEEEEEEQEEEGNVRLSYSEASSIIPSYKSP